MKKTLHDAGAYHGDLKLDNMMMAQVGDKTRLAVLDPSPRFSVYDRLSSLEQSKLGRASDDRSIDLLFSLANNPEELKKQLYISSNALTVRAYGNEGSRILAERMDVAHEDILAVSDSLLEKARIESPSLLGTIGGVLPEKPSIFAVQNEMWFGGNISINKGEEMVRALRGNAPPQTFVPAEVRIGEFGDRPAITSRQFSVSTSPTIMAPGSSPKTLPSSVSSFKPSDIPSLWGTAIGEKEVGMAIRKTDRRIKDFAESMPGSGLARKRQPKVVEGFREEGIAGARRKGWTGFGTGWDAARDLATTFFMKGILGEVGEKFLGNKLFSSAIDFMVKSLGLKDRLYRKMITSDEFQRALQSGKIIERKGEGSYGVVNIMKTEFLGQEFRYAAKVYTSPHVTTSMVDREVLSLAAVQHKAAPTPYGKGSMVFGETSVPAVFMEEIKGATTLTKWTRKHGIVSKENQKMLRETIEELHRQGHVHGDLHTANFLVDEKGRLAVIDPLGVREEILAMFPRVSDRETLVSIGKQLDLMAVDSIASEKSSDRLVQELYRTVTGAIAPAETILPGKVGEASREALIAASYFGEAARRAGPEAEQFAHGMLPLREIPTPKGIPFRETSTGAPKTVPARARRSAQSRAAAEAIAEGREASVAARQTLHVAAVQQCYESASGGGRRSQSMNQSITPVIGRRRRS